MTRSCSCLWGRDHRDLLRGRGCKKRWEQVLWDSRDRVAVMEMEM